MVEEKCINIISQGKGGRLKEEGVNYINLFMTELKYQDWFCITPILNFKDLYKKSWFCKKGGIDEKKITNFFHYINFIIFAF